MSLQFQLKRVALNRVTDVAGVWVHEAGTVTQVNSGLTGTYASHLRITTGGTDVANTAMVTLTIFLNRLGSTAPPENITLQGAHDFTSGHQIGSVSASSLTHLPYIGKIFSRSNDVISIG